MNLQFFGFGFFFYFVPLAPNRKPASGGNTKSCPPTAFCFLNFCFFLFLESKKKTKNGGALFVWLVAEEKIQKPKFSTPWKKVWWSGWELFAPNFLHDYFMVFNKNENKKKKLGIFELIEKKKPIPANKRKKNYCK